MWSIYNKAVQIMERIIKILVFSAMDIFIQTLPLHNGFRLKLNTLGSKEEVAKRFGTLFAKIPQEPNEDIRKEIMSQSYLSASSELGIGCTNQVAKVMYPVGSNEVKESSITGGMNVLNLPLVKQPYDNYKILVATAPPNIKMGGGKDLVIYVVFPEDDSTDMLTPANTPKILFVKDKHDKLHKKRVTSPVFIVDSNRTVTGLKSKEISKHIKFRNKLTNRYGYSFV